MSSLANELEKLAGEAQDLSLPLAHRARIGIQLNTTLRNALPTILSALREREEVVRYFRRAAEGVRVDADAGLWAGIEDEVQDSIDTFNGYADAIEAGEHMKGEG
jgi:hypothetical protein